MIFMNKQLDTTKPIILTRSFHNSRGNYYPAKQTPYYPGEITTDAWEFQYSIQYTEQVKVEIENKALVPEPDVIITNKPQVEVFVEPEPKPTIDLEITEPSEVRELTPSGNKTIKAKVIKHSN